MSWIKIPYGNHYQRQKPDDLNVGDYRSAAEKIETDVVACIEDALDHPVDRQSWKTWLRADRIL